MSTVKFWGMFDPETEILYDPEEDRHVFAAKDLPEGWYWETFGDGSGGLDGPNGEHYFGFDLATEEMRDLNQHWSYIKPVAECERLVKQELVDHANRDKRSFANSFIVYGAGCSFGKINADKYDFVMIAPGYGVPTEQFNVFIAQAHLGEQRNWSDGTISNEELAERLAFAFKNGAHEMFYEGERFDLTYIIDDEQAITPEKMAAAVERKAAEAAENNNSIEKKSPAKGER